jgi:hypothetical protein
LGARPAPRRPEVHDDGLAAQLLNADLMSIELLDSEIRRGVAEEMGAVQSGVLQPPTQRQHEGHAQDDRAGRYHTGPHLQPEAV